MKLQLQLIIQHGWCGVTLERAAPGDIYPSYATGVGWGQRVHVG